MSWRLEAAEVSPRIELSVRHIAVQHHYAVPKTDALAGPITTAY